MSHFSILTTQLIVSDRDYYLSNHDLVVLENQGIFQKRLA